MGSVIVDDDVREARRWSVTAANMEYQLYSLQARYKTEECLRRNNISSTLRYTWLTLVYDELSTVQALVLGQMLDRLSCVSTKLVIVSDELASNCRDALTLAGFIVRSVPKLNCKTSRQGLENLVQMWKTVEFDKIVFIEPTLFPLQNVDEIFDSVSPNMIASPYCSPPGVVHPCFNPSLLAFQPNSDLYSNLYQQFQSSSSCPSLVSVLWDKFVYTNMWTKLSYSYNVKEKRHYPLKVFDLAGDSVLGSVWEWHGKPTRQEAAKLDASLSDIRDIYRLWWKVLYQSLEENKLWFWWHDSALYRKFLHSDPLRDYRAVDIW